MEMVLLQAFGVANDYVQQIAVLLRVSPKYLRRAINRSAGSVCVVSPQIANYPCVIAFHRDNSNVGTCPDPSGSISTVWRPEVYITEHARFTVWSHRSTSLEYDRGLLTLTQKFPLYYCGDHIPSSDHLRQYHLNVAQIITEVPWFGGCSSTSRMHSYIAKVFFHWNRAIASTIKNR